MSSCCQGARSVLLPGEVGWRELECGANGSCGVDAVLVAYVPRQGEEEEQLLKKAIARGRTMRQCVHQWLEERDFEVHEGWVLDAKATEETEGSAPTDWDARAANVLRPARWMCQHTLRATARPLRARIVVIVHGGAQC